jgi:WD40 repeat protein
MTDQTPPSKTRLSWPLVVVMIMLVGASLALAYAWNQARQAALQAEMTLATTTTANLADAERSQATAAASQIAAVTTAQAEIEAAQVIAQAEMAAAQATTQSALATATAAEVAAEVRQAEALSAAAGEAEAQARQAEIYRQAIAALANLPGNPNQSLVLATEAVSASLAAGKGVAPEIIAALRQAIRADRLDSRLAAGHTGPVNDVAISPDSDRLATVGDDGTLRIWDAASGGEILTLTHSAAGFPVYSVAFSPTGDRLATAGFDQTAKIWDAKTGRELLTLTGHKDWVVGVAFSPVVGQNGEGMIATGSQDGTAIIWDAATGKILLTLDSSTGGTVGHSAAINRLTFNPQGDRLATASDDGKIVIWDTASGQALLTLEGHAGPVYDVTFNPQGDRLASASIDGTIKLWESDSGREVRTLRHSRTGWATSVDFSSGGAWLASAGEDGRVVIWDAVTGRERFNLPGHTGAVNGLAISPIESAGSARGDRLASASADGQVHLWQITGNEASLTLPPLANHRGSVYGVAIASSGSQLATSGGEGTVKIWEVTPDKNRLLRTLAPTDTTGALYAVTFSPDGDSLATAGEDGVVTLWETASPALAESGSDARLYLIGHTGPIYALAFNPTGDRLASAGEDGTARLWDSTSGESITILPPSAAEAGGNTGPIYGLAFNPAGNFLATADRNGSIKIWDVDSSEQVASLPSSGTPVRALAFRLALPNAPEGETGNMLAIGGDDGTVRLWTVRQSLRPLPGASAAIQALAFSPDNNRLAATAADGSVTVWSLVSGQVLLRLASPSGIRAGYGLAFLPDGESLITGSQAVSAGSKNTSTEASDGTALRWNIATSELLDLYSPASVKSLALAGSSGSTGASFKGDRLAIAGEDGAVRLWQIEPGISRWSAVPFSKREGTVRVFPTNERAALTSVTMAGDYLAAGDDIGSAWLWSAGSRELLATLAAHTGPVNSLVLLSSPEITRGARLITAGQDDTVKVWPISSTGAIDDRPQLTLRGHTGDVVAVAFSPDSGAAGRLATASHDGTARLWDLQGSGEELLTLTGHIGWLNDVAFSPRGDHLATAGEDGTVRVWDVASGRELLRLASAEGLNGPIKRIAFGPPAPGGVEQLAALMEDGVIRVWSLEQKSGGLSVQPLFQLAPSFNNRPNSLAFDSTGRALLTAGDDGVVRFYALEAEDLLNLSRSNFSP